MKLQNKLIAGFGLGALITLVVAGIGYWQTQRLASALYEVGVVRLPSLQGLDMMSNAMTALEGANRSPSTGPAKLPAEAWAAFDRGWKIYEPLPQAPEEARLWREFVPAAQAWRAECEALNARFSPLAPPNPLAASPTPASPPAGPGSTPHYERARELLTEITLFNHRVIDEAKAHSIASYRDVALVRGLMLFTAAAGVLGAFGLAMLLGRRMSRPMTEISGALAAVGQGNLDVQLQNQSGDEIGQAARGLNRMVEAMRHDVAERNLTALALAESKERLEVALQVSRLGVWRRNPQTGVIEWDARMFGIFGLDAAGGVPDYHVFLKNILPEDRAAVDAAWQRFIAGGAAFEVQFRIRRPDGEVRHILAQSALHRGEGGEPAWIVGVDADLTELFRATEETGRLREQLRQAQKMETLGSLAAGIAHDFNNLLTGINGFIDLSATSLAPDHEVVGLLKQARQGANSARDLVRRILSFSRTTQETERQVTPLALVVRDTAPLIAAGLPAQVTLTIETDDSAPTVRADLGQIQQVLLNLCVNGAQAIGTASGSIRIGVAGRIITGESPDQARPGLYACLSVTDTGSGMIPEVSARIFEPFFTTKKADEGTGLGLAMVKEIATSHGGFVRVQSEAGRGTTFEVFLPAAAGLAVAAPESTTDGAARLRGHGECIFIVDDEPAVRSIVQTALERAGFATEVFADSPAAWAHFKSDPTRCALLLTDLQMPDLSGVEFAVRARRLSATLPIVIMTARTEVLNLAKLREIGGVGVLAKPFGVAELLDRVAASLPARPVVS